MKLDLNFNKLTRLRDWWKQVQNNFKIIEAECSETRVIAESALTSEEAREYMAEFINSTPENMSAIEAFAALLQRHGDSTAALEEIFSDRLRYYAHDSEFDADLVKELYDGIHFCGSGTLNAPTTGNGILLNFSGICQYWLTDNGEFYSRQGNGDWIKSDQAINDRIDSMSEAISSVQESKTEIVFGTYTGNGDESRFIDLGFTPVAVEVYNKNGLQGVSSGGGDETFGGLAFTGFNCGGDSIKIDTGGFYVAQNVSYKKLTNENKEIYYFKAYKTGTIKVVS